MIACHRLRGDAWPGDGLWFDAATPEKRVEEGTGGCLGGAFDEALGGREQGDDTVEVTVPVRAWNRTIPRNSRCRRGEQRWNQAPATA